MSAETNYRTEFVAVLSNHPQGGFIRRRPSSEDIIASSNGRGVGDNGFGSFRSWGFQPRTASRRNDYWLQRLENRRLALGEMIGKACRPQILQSQRMAACQLPQPFSPANVVIHI